ncbi:ATP-dependent sacrificial sulfur transferase LarE [Methanoculleus sp. Wushi-C6]|uniref:ATP-dependent sacrificial sulfur transferase LarE n=1 Tax=Methanoculleus caldifontis TaxID=2651577 RepID=A0ABU3X3J6_9EURY|nr:ATP-dependent sacrificial sulfur transferase LarE [Methanoculleus sp. Wushi-C6]MDV2482623.1 ATP-dependent sacrificial sulfur transferase LarE [Methanoculleus sp. Wushi-C6]
MARDCGLDALLKSYEPIAVALSGGTDSSVLLADARRHNIRAIAISVDTGLTPPGELAAARELSERLGVPHVVIPLDMLEVPAVRENRPDRCYVCKRMMMEAIVREAERQGCRTVVDGTHAGDRADARPGMRALRELGIRSPFSECGMGKADIETLAGELGITVRPPSACLATRIPTGEPVSRECLALVAAAEALLAREIPGTLRVRCTGRHARASIEADPAYHERLEGLLGAVKDLGFEDVTIAQEGYREGGADSWKR